MSRSVSLFVLCLLAASPTFAATVYSNGAAPGDSFTNIGGSNQGQAVNGSGWYYNNVRDSGVVGISTNFPRSGNGSAYLQTTFGPGGASSKADIELLASGVNLGGNFYASAIFGTFASLSSASYEWYRASSSTASANQHPSLRVLLDADGNLNTTGDRGGVVFERAYNAGSVATDTWVGDSVGSGTYLWNFGLGVGSEFNINATPYAYDATLAEWQAYFPNAVVLGFSSGVGSGWGPFTGAVDNISYSFNGGASGSANFEVSVVPLPAAAWAGLALMGTLGAGKLVRGRRAA